MNRETKDRAAVAAVAALYCIPVSSVKVEIPDDTSPNRFEQWVSRKTMDSIGDAIADALEPDCIECGQPNGEHTADCMGVN